MIKLYVKTGCPFCAAVLKKVDELGLKVEELNVADERIAKELVEKGGKKREPYLIDEDRGVSMYESYNIIDYLEEHYGDGSGSTSKDAEILQGGTCSI